MKTIQEFVTEMTRVIRNTDLDDLIQFHAFRQVAEEKIQEFADQQNKELREENERLHKKTESMERGIEASQRMVESEILERDAEIQRLTKEVEELKLKLSGKTFFNPFEQELTRLRELLKKAKGCY